MMSEPRFHPAAAIFPMMSEEEIGRLAEDIKANGQKEPIRTHDGLIVDGRNRFMACRIAGIDPWFTPWNGKGDLAAFVISLNLHRRHLNESQRAMAASRLEEYEAEEARKRQGARTDLKANLPEGSRGQARDKAAAKLNVSGRSVSDAKKVITSAAPELVSAVEQGRIAVSLAAKLIDCEHAKQRALVAAVDGGKKPSAVAADLKREERTAKLAEISANNAPLDGSLARVPVLYADPPWSYDNSLSKTWRGRVWLNPPWRRKG